MTTQDGNNDKDGTTAGAPQAASSAVPEQNESAMANTSPEPAVHSAPQRWWRRVLGTAQHTLDTRIKPPANFGFPPVPNPNQAQTDAELGDLAAAPAT
ncbi:MAG: AI-2E family transporter, partial [Paeniglutamicibacter terrestris]